MIQIASPQGRFITREKAKNPNSLKLVALIVLSLFSSVSYTAPIISTDGGVLSLKGFAESGKAEQGRPLNNLLNSGSVHNYSGLEIDYKSPMFNSQFTVNLNHCELNINGETSASLYGTEFVNGVDGPGNHLFYLSESTLKLSGDVVAKIEQPDGPEAVGANLLYADKGSYAEVGKSDSIVRMWAIARSPDLISAKKGSKVKFNSTKNQLLGTIDLMDNAAINSEVNSVEIVFSGPDAYWFGDEKTYMNTDYKFQPNYDDWLLKEADNLTLTFNNQAQWSYLGIQVEKAGYYTIPKRISSIELNGGIINLYDADVERYWKELGIWDLIQNEAFDMNVEGKHDYVRIGHLKGNGGIFRLDLNGDDKTQSDMVYIESGEGTHYFEPYNLQLLESITPENTLTFALVAKGSSVQFRDKQNIHGQALVDYELEIAKKEGITEEDLNNPDNAYWDKTANIDVATADQAELARKIYMNEFKDGTNWFIRRVTLKESAAAVGMTGAGYASYDAAIEMDRRDRRLAEQVRDIENSDNGLWVRVHHGRSGAENQYRWDRTGATVGIDRQITSNNRLGAYFTYTQGDTEFLDVRGDGDMNRYELAVFDTLQLGQHYFDFVGRLGRVSSDFNVGNQSYSTSGDFDQDYAAVSAEYGYQLLDTNGVFIEPQLQVQVAYVDGYDYDSQRGMQVDVDGETSVIGRAGLRAGREITTSSSNGSFFARADIYHQFTDGQDAVFSDQQGHRLDVNWGDTDTWASFGVGTSWVWKNRLGLQLDVEKVAGGKTEDTWLMSGRFSYLF